MYSHSLFKPIEVEFVVEDDEARWKLLELLPWATVHVCHITRAEYGMTTISHVRQWISQQLLDDGEWALLVDDNTQGLTRVADDYYNEEKIDFDLEPVTSSEWRKIYATPVSYEDMWLRIEELKAKCESLGTIFGGLAVPENFYFRKIKWQLFGYAKAKFAVWKNDRSLSWVTQPENVLEDMVMSVQVVCKYGCVANNRFMRVTYDPYQTGGIGTEMERYPILLQTVQYLLEKYPGLIGLYKNDPAYATFAKRHPTSVNRWRQEHGYLGDRYART
jgi:hypothetical protein